MAIVEGCVFQVNQRIHKIVLVGREYIAEKRQRSMVLTGALTCALTMTIAITTRFSIGA